MLFRSLAAAALLSVAQALDIQVVAVGVNPVNNQTGLKYYPEKLTAKPGTMVQFQFWAGNHTLTQSNFDNPCVPLSVSNSSLVGIDSEHQPVADSASKGEIPTFTIMINDTKPLWFYCKTGTHCEAGMSLVINENTTANATRSLAEYQKLSKSVSGAGNASGDGSDSTPPGNAASALSMSVFTTAFLAVGVAFMLL